MNTLEPIMWAVLASLLYGVYYMIDCIRYRWDTCPKSRCKGGKIRSRLSGKTRDCRRCDGKGRRLRLGWRLWTWYAGRQHAQR